MYTFVYIHNIYIYTVHNIIRWTKSCHLKCKLLETRAYFVQRIMLHTVYTNIYIHKYSISLSIYISMFYIYIYISGHPVILAACLYEKMNNCGFKCDV